MSNVLFTKNHEWLKIDDEKGTFGITEYAALQLGDVTYIQLPALGDEVSQNDFICEIESVKAASDIFLPVSGKITKVNENLNDSPELLNKDPLEKGWIGELTVSDKAETDNLLTEKEYKEYLETL
ncbi:MAG: glycine cleavage system protein GcvH [Elusimicrobia bacterium]|nr:glycine cleavage system protein GcvH [Elusimicrobiota bacterium]